MKLGGRWPITPVQLDNNTPVGINVGIGSVMIVAAALVGAPSPGADQPARLGVVAGAVGLFAAISVDQLALAGVVVLGWLVTNGFLENHRGELSWHSSSDPYLITLLVIAGAVGLATGEAYRGIRRLRAQWRAEVQLQEFTAQFKEKEKHDA